MKRRSQAPSAEEPFLSAVSVSLFWAKPKIDMIPAAPESGAFKQIVNSRSRPHAEVRGEKHYSAGKGNVKQSCRDQGLIIFRLADQSEPMRH
ncbi:MAG: hypothetical protein AB8I69_02805, partial [Anaerolineae bacterium]